MNRPFRLGFKLLVPFQKSAVRFQGSGFTLTEISITVGIIGLIMAAIWLVAASVYEGHNIGVAERQFIQLSQALENVGPSLSTTLSQSAALGNGYYYAGAMNDLFLDMSSVLPPDMVNKEHNLIIHPWAEKVANLPFAVVITVGTYIPSYGYSEPAGIPPASAGSLVPPAGAKVDTFEILYNGIPTDACVALVTYLTGNNRDPYIVTVFINNWSAGSGIQTFPITPNVAASKCNPASNTMGGPVASGSGNLLDGFNSIDVVYKFR